MNQPEIPIDFWLSVGSPISTEVRPSSQPSYQYKITAIWTAKEQDTGILLQTAKELVLVFQHPFRCDLL